MWTSESRARYDRGKLRYPSDLTDAEWQLVKLLIPPGKPGGGKRTVIMREVVNGLMYVLSTGCQWDQQFDQLPFRVSQITRIAQFATVITRAAFARPHRVTPSSNQATSFESQLIHLIQELSGRTPGKTSEQMAPWIGSIPFPLTFYIAGFLVFFRW